MEHHLKHVVVRRRPLDGLTGVLSTRAYARFVSRAATAAEVMRGRAIWNVSSTVHGGGVAEMLHSALGYARGAGVDARWVVIRDGDGFFAVTKQLHNQLHGAPGAGVALDAAARAHYERTLAGNAAELVSLVADGDVVILHDPQTAGLLSALAARGVPTVWRAHIGCDAPNALTREAWAFLMDYVRHADAVVFSRREHVWDGIDPTRVAIIPPALDPVSPKNQRLDPRTVRSVLVHAGILSAATSEPPVFLRLDGSPGRVDRRARCVEEQPLATRDRVVLCVSRWDRLKDQVGVLEGFARCDTGAHLVLAGPDPAGVTDDPEGAEVYEEVEAAWLALEPATRRRVHLVNLPMTDPDENAVIVNALQRHATIVVQKSLAEGFGLTVAEAMFKQRPVVGSRVGGIQDQIEDGVSGMLVDDPTDRDAFAAILTRLLGDAPLRRRLSVSAHARVRGYFLVDRQLTQHSLVVEAALRGRGAVSPSRSPSGRRNRSATSAAAR